MDGRAVKVGYESNQIKIADLFNGSYIVGFKIRSEFVYPGAQCLDGAVGKVRQSAIGRKLLDILMKHVDLPLLAVLSCFIINALFSNPNCPNCGV